MKYRVPTVSDKLYYLITNYLTKIGGIAWGGEYNNYWDNGGCQPAPQGSVTVEPAPSSGGGCGATPSPVQNGPQGGGGGCGGGGGGGGGAVCSNQLNQLFNQYLGRCADASGQSTWTGQCINQVIAGITGSAEYAGRGTPVSGGGCGGCNIRAVASPMQMALSGGGGCAPLTAEQVNQVYKQELGRCADASGKATFTGKTLAEVLSGITGSAEYVASHPCAAAATPTCFQSSMTYAPSWLDPKDYAANGFNAQGVKVCTVSKDSSPTAKALAGAKLISCTPGDDAHPQGTGVYLLPNGSQVIVCRASNEMTSATAPLSTYGKPCMTNKGYRGYTYTSSSLGCMNNPTPCQTICINGAKVPFLNKEYLVDPTKGAPVLRKCGAPITICEVSPLKSATGGFDQFMQSAMPMLAALVVSAVSAGTVDVEPEVMAMASEDAASMSLQGLSETQISQILEQSYNIGSDAASSIASASANAAPTVLETAATTAAPALETAATTAAPALETAATTTGLTGNATLNNILATAGKGALTGGAMGGIRGAISGGCVFKCAAYGAAMGGLGGGLGSFASPYLGTLGGQIVGGAGAGALGAGFTGRNILQGAGIGALGSGVAGATGSIFPGLPAPLTAALTSGALTSAMGGKFLTGAESGALGSIIGGGVSKYINPTTSVDAIKPDGQQTGTNNLDYQKQLSDYYSQKLPVEAYQNAINSGTPQSVAYNNYLNAMQSNSFPVNTTTGAPWNDTGSGLTTNISATPTTSDVSAIGSPISTPSTAQTVSFTDTLPTGGGENTGKFVTPEGGITYDVGNKGIVTLNPDGSVKLVNFDGTTQTLPPGDEATSAVLNAQKFGTKLIQDQYYSSLPTNDSYVPDIGSAAETRLNSVVSPGLATPSSPFGLGTLEGPNGVPSYSINRCEPYMQETGALLKTPVPSVFSDLMTQGGNAVRNWLASPANESAFNAIRNFAQMAANDPAFASSPEAISMMSKFGLANVATGIAAMGAGASVWATNFLQGNPAAMNQLGNTIWPDDTGLAANILKNAQPQPEVPERFAPIVPNPNVPPANPDPFNPRPAPATPAVPRPGPPANPEPFTPTPVEPTQPRVPGIPLTPILPSYPGAPTPEPAFPVEPAIQPGPITEPGTQPAPSEQPQKQPEPEPQKQTEPEPQKQTKPEPQTKIIPEPPFRFIDPISPIKPIDPINPINPIQPCTPFPPIPPEEPIVPPEITIPPIIPPLSVNPPNVPTSPTSPGKGPVNTPTPNIVKKKTGLGCYTPPTVKYPTAKTIHGKQVKLGLGGYNIPTEAFQQQLFNPQSLQEIQTAATGGLMKTKKFKTGGVSATSMPNPTSGVSCGAPGSTLSGTQVALPMSCVYSLPNDVYAAPFFNPQSLQQIQAAKCGGSIQHMFSGGSLDFPASQGLTHGRRFEFHQGLNPLTGLAPVGHAEGGDVHNPQFYSEGGLNNTYVKGEGDGTSDSIPAMLANGEFVIPADVVSSLGNGSNDSGAKVLDELLKTIRSHKRKADAKHLPPDSKGALGYLLEAKKKAKK